MKTAHTSCRYIVLLIACIGLGMLQAQQNLHPAQLPFTLEGKYGIARISGVPEEWKLTHDSVELRIRLKHIDTLPAWERADSLEIVWQAGRGTALLGTLHIQGRRAQLMFPVEIPVEGKTVATFPLHEFPLTAGTDTPKKVFLTLIGKPGTCLQIASVRLFPHTGDRSAIRDRYGQRISTDWPNKVSSDEQLRLAGSAEWSELAAMPGPPHRNAFGSWTGGAQYEATGFFRTEKLGNPQESLQAWTLVDPEGYPFWSLGVTGLRHKYPTTDVTRWAGRADLFDSLPPLTGLYALAYEERDFVSFYTWNILRKWGSLKRWREVSFTRLQKWGMNTLGNWAHESVLAESPLPYTRAIRSNRGNAPLVGDSHMPDVFDPRWSLHLDTLLAQTTSWKEDSLLLGYFVDNEMGWGNLNLLGRADSNDYLRAEWRYVVQSTFAYLDILNQSWGTDFSSWEEVAQMQAGPDSIAAFQNLYLEFESAFADTYFRLIATKLKQHDPNHLYLGCRFTRLIKPDHVIQAAGRYVDILSVNVYSYEPIRADMDAWHRLSGGLPMLIGEHHVSLRGARQLSPNFQDFSPEERYTYYLNYLKVWSQTPYAVGCHWYQYKDQPLTGRGADGQGERRVVGLVDITDQPHLELVKAIREVSEGLYRWKFDQG